MASRNLFTLFISLIFLPLTLATDLHTITTNEMSKLQTMTIDEYINYINPPAIHKFQNANGESILCVKYEDQKSLQPGSINAVSRQSLRDNFILKNSSIEECPHGSVPIVEITRERVERAGSVRQYLQNTRLLVRPDSAQDQDQAFDDLGAAGEMRANEIRGVKAVFNVWQPTVEGDDSSVSEMLLYHETPDHSAVESIQAGLMVYRAYYGDPRVRFFIYRGGYGVDCLNLECGGFIQEGEFYPGLIFNHVSIYGGVQQETTISIKIETRGNNPVWAVYLQEKLVGHWPAASFKELTSSANVVSLGGRVIAKSSGPGTPYTKTDMGSGRFPGGYYGKAAYIRNIQLFTAQDVLISKMRRDYGATMPECYDVKGFLKNDNYTGNIIYFGGPGGDVAGFRH